MAVINRQSFKLGEDQGIYIYPTRFNSLIFFVKWSGFNREKEIDFKMFGNGSGIERTVFGSRNLVGTLTGFYS